MERSGVIAGQPQSESLHHSQMGLAWLPSGQWRHQLGRPGEAAATLVHLLPPPTSPYSHQAATAATVKSSCIQAVFNIIRIKFEYGPPASLKNGSPNTCIYGYKTHQNRIVVELNVHSMHIIISKIKGA